LPDFAGKKIVVVIVIVIVIDFFDYDNDNDNDNDHEYRQKIVDVGAVSAYIFCQTSLVKKSLS